MAFTTYSGYSDWTISTTGGVAASKGFLCFSASIQTLFLTAKYYNKNTREQKRVDFKVELTGFEVGASIGGDIVEEVTGIGLEYIKTNDADQRVYLNVKDSSSPKIADLLGPCAMVSFDVGKATYIKEHKKYAGNTYLFLGWGKTVMDTDPKWLNNMLDKLENGDTWGSYNKKFVENHGILSNSRAVCSISLDGLSASAKIDNKIGLFSGQISGSNAYRI